MVPRQWFIWDLARMGKLCYGLDPGVEDIRTTQDLFIENVVKYAWAQSIMENELFTKMNKSW